jgi:hypothetical protein
MQNPTYEDLLKYQTKMLEDGMLKVNIVNPRDDRTLTEHGSDTQAGTVKHMVKLKDMLKLINKKECPIVQATVREGLCLPYGQCFKNTIEIAKERGGRCLVGWAVFEGKYLLELEAHCIWKTLKGEFINVTNSIHYESIVQPMTFVIDSSSFDNEAVAMANVMFWK